METSDLKYERKRGVKEYCDPLGSKPCKVPNSKDMRRTHQREDHVEKIHESFYT